MRSFQVSTATALILMFGISPLSHAWTISMSCAPYGDTGLPFENARCEYHFDPAGNPQALRGWWEAALWYTQTYQLLDYGTTGEWNFSQPPAPSPHRIWIACADTVGWYNVRMNGKSLRFVLGGGGSSGYWAFVQNLGPTINRFVSQPVSCP